MIPSLFFLTHYLLFSSLSHPSSSFEVEEYEPPIFVSSSSSTNGDSRQKSPPILRTNKEKTSEKSEVSFIDPGLAFRKSDDLEERFESSTRSTLRTSTLSTSTLKTPNKKNPGFSTTRDPFSDPNRYRIPLFEDDTPRFVNGQPYREPDHILERYGNAFDPRWITSLSSDTVDLSRMSNTYFSDPRVSDPRNIPKLKGLPSERFDSQYRYYERFPNVARSKVQQYKDDPLSFEVNEEPRSPGVLGGWLPALQGNCRPGCENLYRDVTVNTNYGRVNGFLVQLYDGPGVPVFERPGYANVDRIQGTLSVFLGIPYAQPPIGDARLMPPRPHRGWQSIDAVDWAPVCPQPLRFVGATKNSPLMDEDCLYLNVFTPSVDSGQSQLFPVMLYIHGGEFIQGSGNEFPGHQLSFFGRVVVVTFNYRLGALGYLSTADENAPGNYGLLDQALALKWVYDNIYAFQGDRKRITVFGPGAGGASAGLLSLMPKTRSMVRRVILISGSPLADWAAISDKFRVQNTSSVFGERVGCTVESSWKLVDCLRRGRSFLELTNVEFKPEIGLLPWAPLIQINVSLPQDGWYEEWTSDDFSALPDTVFNLFENINPNIEFLTGVSRDDASYMIYENKTLAPDYKIDWKFFDEMLRDHINQYNYTLNPEGIFNAIKYMYTYYPDPNNVSHIREEFINFYSDFYFRAPQDALVKTLIANRVRTYVYVQNTTVEALKLPYWRQIPHNLEHYFLSGAPFMDSVFFPHHVQVSRHLWTENDRNMSEFFIYAFSNFSWYGNPTPSSILGVSWEPVRRERSLVDSKYSSEGHEGFDLNHDLKYLSLNTTENSSTLFNYRQRECAFWTLYLPSVISYVTPTYPPTTEFWWEPESPLQIAFWSSICLSLLLIVLVLVCCLLWRNAKRDGKDGYIEDEMRRSYISQSLERSQLYPSSSSSSHTHPPPRPRASMTSNSSFKVSQGPSSLISDSWTTSEEKKNKIEENNIGKKDSFDFSQNDNRSQNLKTSTSLETKVQKTKKMKNEHYRDKYGETHIDEEENHYDDENEDEGLRKDSRINLHSPKFPSSKIIMTNGSRTCRVPELKEPFPSSSMRSSSSLSSANISYVPKSSSCEAYLLDSPLPPLPLSKENSSLGRRSSQRSGSEVFPFSGYKSSDEVTVDDSPFIKRSSSSRFGVISSTAV